MEPTSIFADTQQPLERPGKLEDATGPIVMLPAVHQLLSRQDTDRHIFNVTVLWELHMSLEYQVLKQTVAFLLRHHDGLRARFSKTDQGWQASIIEPDDSSVPVERIDLSMVDEDQQSAAIEAEAERLQQTLDLFQGPLLRIVHFFLGEQRPCRLLFMVHHFICDGLSLDLLQQDFFTVYHQLRQGQVAWLPPKTTSVQAYGECLADYAHSEALHKELAYWDTPQRRQIATLPADYPEGISIPAVRKFIPSVLNEQETSLLLSLARQRMAISDVLLAVLFQTYTHWTGEKSMLVEISHHGRKPPFPHIDLARTVGWIINPVPLLLFIEQAGDIRKVVHAVKEQLRQAPHDGMGFGVLRFLGNKQVQERLRSLPQPQLLFNYMGRLPSHIEEAQAIMQPARESLRNTLSQQMVDPVQLCFTTILRKKTLEISCQYQENLYKRSTIESFMQSFLDRLREASHLLSSNTSDLPAR
ncbi:MAG TPA: condensation domain-containing protein [Ktedonobacteraceae bacterium]|nr:condensation domain-containing protein [Ktedonobacteraceae bacterium]